MYVLGQYTRNRYKKILPDTYTKKSFTMYTTNVDRTIISAQLYLAGLYPPTKEEIWHDSLLWNPIPTFVADAPILRSVPVFFCPTYAEALTKSLNKRLDEFKKSTHAEYILSNTGLTTEDYSQLAYLYDSCSVLEDFGLELPEWTKKVYPDVLREITLNYLLGTFETDQMKRLCKYFKIY